MIEPRVICSNSIFVILDENGRVKSPDAFLRASDAHKNAHPEQGPYSLLELRMRFPAQLMRNEEELGEGGAE